MKLNKYLEMISSIAPQFITRVIIGNQAADYDSIIGSIVLGYIKLVLFKQLFVPVIDCKRSELKLRFQVVKLLETNKINTQSLKFKEDIDVNAVEELILYDHNIRSDFKVKPVEIVDHHFMKDKQCKKTLVGHCGSCTTLLYYLLRNKELKPGSEWINKYEEYFCEQKNQQIQYDPVIDELIRAGILLDTYNLNEKQKSRWVQIDKIALQNIQTRLKDKQLISFDYLQNLKFDTELNMNMALQQHLVKDFKQFTYPTDVKIAYSIVLMQPATFLNHYNKQVIKEELTRIMKQQNYQAYFLMFLYQKQSVPTRESILYSDNKEVWELLNSVLKDKLKMNEISSEEGSIYYRDPTNTVSRKVLEKQVSLAFENKSNNNQL